ncbi:MAG: hypothetical protein M1836_006102 [Candelina mexicana]|nr:MAG: hypothetical protein M1836_006102 [Candelina mexicana]
MSAPQPPTATPASPQSYQTFKHNLSLGLCLACPLLILLPPRKLDIFTFSLSTAFVLSLNEQSVQRTNLSLLQQLNKRKPAFVRDLPTEEARDVQERLKRERLLRAQPSGQGMERGVGVGFEAARSGEGATGEKEGLGIVEQVKGKEGERKKGLAEKIWMGDEQEGWRERRIREEKEAIEEGRGYGGLIMDQIWEVWNWGRKSDGEDEDEKR